MPPELLAKVDELLIVDPLVTVRHVAEVVGVSRDTVHRRRKKLVAGGKLPDLSRKEYGRARNRLRFAGLDLERAPHRRRLHDCSITLRIQLGDGQELDWTSEPSHFRGPVPVTKEEADELLELFMRHLSTSLWKQLVREEKRFSAALERWKARPENQDLIAQEGRGK